MYCLGGLSEWTRHDSVIILWLWRSLNNWILFSEQFKGKTSYVYFTFTTQVVHEQLRFMGYTRRVIRNDGRDTHVLLIYLFCFCALHYKLNQSRRRTISRGRGLRPSPSCSVARCGGTNELNTNCWSISPSEVKLTLWISWLCYNSNPTSDSPCKM